MKPDIMYEMMCLARKATDEERIECQQLYKKASCLIGKDWNEFGKEKDTSDENLAEAAKILAEYRIKTSNIKIRD